MSADKQASYSRRIKEFSSHRNGAPTWAKVDTRSSLSLTKG
jgi:hypothetical protein